MDYETANVAILESTNPEHMRLITGEYQVERLCRQLEAFKTYQQTMPPARYITDDQMKVILDNFYLINEDETEPANPNAIQKFYACLEFLRNLDENDHTELVMEQIEHYYQKIIGPLTSAEFCVVIEAYGCKSFDEFSNLFDRQVRAS